MASMAPPLYGAVASSSYSHRGKGVCFLATGGAPRVWRGMRRLRRGIGAAHRRAGSRARGDDAALSLSRISAPTCCMRSSLITLHSYSSMSREQTSLAKEPQSHGQPKKRSSDAAWTGEVAALVHLDVVLVANDILLPQLQCKRTQSTRVNLSPEKKRPFLKCGFWRVVELKHRVRGARIRGDRSPGPSAPCYGICS